MKFWRILKLTLVSVVLLTIILLAVMWGIVHFYKGEIVQEFVRRVNTHIKQQIHVADIDLSLSTFPHLAIHITDLKIGSGEEQLATAKDLYIGLDILDIMDNRYVVKHIKLSDGTIDMMQRANGSNNYDLLKESNGGGSLDFSLEKITLTKVDYSFRNPQTNIQVRAIDVSSALSKDDQLYSVILNGEVEIDKVEHKSIAYIDKKRMDLQTSLSYDMESKKLEFDESSILLNESAFTIDGMYALENKHIELHLSTPKSDLSTIASVLPNHISKYLSTYKASGQTDLKIELSGSLGGSKPASLLGIFKLQESKLSDPSTNLQFEKTNLEGKFELPDLNHPERGQLQISNASGELQNKPFNGDFVIKDFKNPRYMVNFKGSLLLEELLALANNERLTNPSGTVDIDIEFDGRREDLTTAKGLQHIRSSGQVSLKEINFSTNNGQHSVSEVNGTLLFNNSDVAINAVSGVINQSDFEINGFFKNLISYLILPDQPLGIDATLTSNELLLDKLMKSESNNADGNYHLSIPGFLRLNLMCNIGHLAFQRISCDKLTGHITVKDKVLRVTELSMETLGGNLTVNGYLSQQSAKLTEINGNLNYKNIQIPKLFHTFHNFNQTFILDTHLKGNLSGNANIELALDKNLKLLPETLNSSIAFNIQNGELIDFRPLMDLSKYANHEDLSHLYFSDLNSSIMISDETVSIPAIEVGSNIADIEISGRHGFNHQIDYSVVVPLKINSKADSDEAFGAIEQTAAGKSKLFLKIEGTTTNYEVKYDTDRVSKKISQDLKRELDELKATFKNKGLKKDKKVELAEDDYFDWD